MKNSRYFTPTPGLGITYAINGDSYPYTIRRVSPSDHQFWATRDRFIAKPGANEPYGESDKVGVFEPEETLERMLRAEGTAPTWQKEPLMSSCTRVAPTNKIRVSEQKVDEK